MVSVQVRRSSRRSLLSCRANRYLGGGRSTEVRPKAPGTHVPVLRRTHSLATRSRRYPGSLAPQRSASTRRAAHHTPGTNHPEARFQGGSSQTRAPCVIRHNHTHGFVGSSRKSQQGQSVKCGFESQRDG